MMGMEHERIHIETSSVLIRQLPVDMLTKPNGWKYAPKQSSKLNIKILSQLKPVNKSHPKKHINVVIVGKLRSNTVRRLQSV